jgi:hypothetical protein
MPMIGGATKRPWTSELASKNIDEERSFTVPEPAKVPPGYVYTTPYALEVGKIVVFDLGAVQVDIDGHA